MLSVSFLFPELAQFAVHFYWLITWPILRRKIPAPSELRGITIQKSVLFIYHRSEAFNSQHTIAFLQLLISFA
jgi:hypothetical protein